MNFYLDLFYKKQIPALVLLFSPLAWYAYGFDYFHNLFPSHLKTILFGRLMCDVEALSHAPGYNVDRYASAYFSGIVVLVVAAIIHILNVVIALKEVQTKFSYNNIYDENPVLGFILAFAFTAITFLALSRWRLSGEMTYGCSWFYDVQNTETFRGQFWRALALIGLLQTALLAGTMTIIMRFLSIIRR